MVRGAAHDCVTSRFSAGAHTTIVAPSQHAQPISYVFLISRQGKVRLSKFYDTVSAKERTKLTREVAALVLNRPAKQVRRLDVCRGRAKVQ